MPPIIHIKETLSTNSYLRQLLTKKQLDEGTVVVTDLQTAGRGQRGNAWESEKGKNLTFSIYLSPTFLLIDKQFVLSQIVSVALKNTLDKYSSEITIKWPNDIYWKNKKIAGILIENLLGDNKIEACIIGIGLNVNQTAFVSNAPNPISLYNITKLEYNLNNILMDIQENILELYHLLKSGESFNIMESYNSSLFRKDGYHPYHDGVSEFEAKIKNIESTGHLVLETRDGAEKKFAFKEVKHIL